MLVGVMDVEFWKVMSHAGSVVRKKFAKWCWTSLDPWEPGTRGTRIGARRAPFLMSKSAPGWGRARRVESVSLVYADAEVRHWRRSRKLASLGSAFVCSMIGARLK